MLSTSPKPTSWLAACVLSLLASAAAAQEQDGGSCAKCHQAEAAAEADSPHARAGVTCTTCHGGDATQATKEAAKAAGTGFKKELKGVDVVNLCGSCHADVGTMNPYGLPTDQLAQYRTSEHGQALFTKGDTKVATCVSCHGTHGILGPESSDSPVNPANVPKTCGKCHGDEALMSQYSIDAGIPKAWHDSVHATALLEKGDLSAPTCATCHGSHGAVPPGFATVAAVCGKCHVRERDLFEKSPHAALVAEGDFPGCEVCHSNHDVRPASTAILDRACGLCHAEGEEALTKRDRIESALQAASKSFDATSDEVKVGAAEGLVTEDDQLLLDEASTALKSMRVVQHTLDPARVEEVTSKASDDLKRISGNIATARKDKRMKRLSLLPVVAFLTMMSVGFWMRFRRIHLRRSHRTDGRPHS